MGEQEQSDDFVRGFESAFARLQVLVEMACVSKDPWPKRVGLAVQRALEFAAGEPAAAKALTVEALARGADGIERYERLMDFLVGLLEVGRGESPRGAELPATTERALAGGVAAIVANRVDRHRAAELPGLLAEVVQFILTPYMGAEEARRIAVESDWPSSQRDR